MLAQPPGVLFQVYRGVRTVFLLAAAAATVGTLLGFSSWWWLPGELASHFRVQYLVAALPALLTLAAMRHWRAAALAGIAVPINLAVILPLYWPAAVKPGAGSALRVTSINVYSDNRRPSDVLAFIRRSGPEIVLLMEVTPAWQSVIDALQADYPYQKITLRDDNFGIALISRIRLDEVAMREFGESEVPSIVARLHWSGTPLLLIGTHPLPPVRRENWLARNSQFQALAKLCRSESGPQIVIGDLNSTSWSAHFATLLDGTRLRDSRQGFGIQASWPVWPPLPRIPIDHCLISPEVAVRQRVIGPNIGSDHYPLVIDLVVSTLDVPKEAKDESPEAQP
jgi:endonuclease/exonuclease/phosphatase (EEP) superfamily protein YafD